MQITGIILAGGNSSRMGIDKALLEIDGQTLLSRAVELCRVFCDEILISSNNTKHNASGCLLVADELAECGPMGGVYSCLKQSQNEWNLILSVDATFVEKDFVDFLLEWIQDFDAVVPAHSGKKEPLIALYNKKIISDLHSQLESRNYKMRFFLEKIRTNFIDSNNWERKYPKLFHNINSPEDLMFG